MTPRCLPSTWTLPLCKCLAVFDKLQAELAASGRLRLGLALIVAVLWFYGALLVRDARDERTRAFRTASVQLVRLQQAVQAVHVSDALIDYLQNLLDATRDGRWFEQGLSPRAGLAILQAAKARALLSGRDYVAPDDVQVILPHTAAHRLVPVSTAGRGAVEQIHALLRSVPLQ